MENCSASKTRGCTLPDRWQWAVTAVNGIELRNQNLCSPCRLHVCCLRVIIAVVVVPVWSALSHLAVVESKFSARRPYPRVKPNVCIVPAAFDIAMGNPRCVYCDVSGLQLEFYAIARIIEWAYAVETVECVNGMITRSNL